MNILLAFVPFLAFALVDRFTGPTDGLLAGAAVSAILIVREWLMSRSPKILEVGTMILFGGLSLYALRGSPTWSVIAVRLWVDAGLLAIVLVSMAVGRPFTMQYARDTVAPEFWNSPAFLRTNTVITGAWAVAFAAMVAAELALLYVPDMPQRLGVIVIIVALVAAIKFTAWYPERARANGAA